MRCLRCGNQDARYFYKGNGIWYCRKCVSFGRVNVGTLPLKQHYIKRKIKTDFTLQYPLTKQQKSVSSQILQHIMHHQNVLVYAACGAGKTELVMEAICTYLNAGKKVGFAISRRQVVLEIKERMQAAFTNLRVIAVCEGYTSVIDGDLIICTMHQLYRYHRAFDLLIMDEVDAFPYRDNEVLEHIAMHACIGEKIFLTATPDDEMKKACACGILQKVELFQRPHGYPLIVPEIRRGTKVMQYFYLIQFLYRQRSTQKQTLVFVPTIHLAKCLTLGIKWLFKCTSFTSQTADKEGVIQKFHQKDYECLISTTVLERGITIKGIYVVILQADHVVFNEASLIQMIGRVGRNIEMPTGKGLFLCTRKTKDITNCIQALQMMNRSECD